MFVLDYNEDRSLQISSEEEKAAGVHVSKGTMNFDAAVQNLQGVSEKVHIGSLTSYEHYGGGIFTMTDVKRIRAKEAFLQMPLAERNCEVELYEDCRTRKLLGECNCVPWELPGYQVGSIKRLRIGQTNCFDTGHEDMQSQRQGLH